MTIFPISAVQGGKTQRFLLAALALILVQALAPAVCVAQTIVVYGDAGLPPYEFIEDGAPKGVNIDLWRAIGTRLGRPVDIRLTDWAAAQANVRDGKGDVLSLMTSTPEREVHFSFTQSTFPFTFSLFVKTGDASGFDRVPLTMRRIGVTAGGFSKPYFEKTHPDVSLLLVADNIDGIRRLLRGDIDAFAASTWSGNYLIRELGISGVTPLPKPFAERNAGIAVPKGNPRLLEEIDQALGRIKADGTFDRIVDRWAGDRVLVFSEKDIQLLALAAGSFLMLVVLVGVVLMARHRHLVLSREMEAQIAAREAQAKIAREIEDLYDNAPCGYHSLDADGLFLNINRTEARWLGYDRAEIVGKLRAQDILTPRSVETFRASFPRFKEIGFIQDLELDFIRKDKSILHGLVSASAVFDDNGRYLMSRSALIDNGPRKQAEAALRESEVRFRGAFETAAHGMALVSPEGRFLKVNPALCAMLGFDEAELLADDFQTPTHPDDQAADLGHVRELLDGRIESYQMEKRYYHRTGRLIWAQLSVSLVRSVDGAPIHFVAHVQDITPQKNATAETEHRLDATRRAVGALVDANPHPMAILSLGKGGAFVIDHANERLARLLQRSPDMLVGGILHGWPPDASRAAVLGALNRNEHAVVELALDHPEGLLDVELLFTPISQMGTVMLSIRDRTQERRVARKEAERHRLEALGRMAGRIAHEINNVLQPVLTYASLAAQECQGNPKAQAYLADAQDGIREGRDIVRSVLALAGGNTVARQPRLLEEEVAKDLGLLSATVPDGIALDTSLESTRGMVSLAPSELLQILSNLIVNAIDAISGQGRIQIRTAFVSLDDGAAAAIGVAPGRYAELTVTDSGKGMDEGVLIRAFDPFFTTKSVDKGTGLGLSTVRTILDGMGGGISLSSTPGVGTTVRVVFPLVVSAC